MAKIDEHVKVMMLKGEPGSSIKSIDKTATSGLTDTYTITLTNGDKQQFNVTNGKQGEGLQSLEIGGRNLLLGTMSGMGWEGKGGGVFAFNAAEQAFSTSSKHMTTVNETYIETSLDLEPDTEYTLSAWIKSNGKVASVDFHCADKSVTCVRSLTIESVPTEYKRFELVFTTDPTLDWSGAVIRFDNNGSVEDGTEAVLYVKHPQLERGNKPSDWTPAPEDKANVSAIVRKELVESTATASQAYSDGDFLVVNGLLRRATAAIAKGEPISEGNSTDTTVAAELRKLAMVVGKTDTWHALYESDDWSVYYTERGGVLYVRAHVGKLGTSWWKAGTLPFGYRPQMDFYAPVYNYSENACAGIFVGKNGDVSMHSYQAQSATTSWAIVAIPLW